MRFKTLTVIFVAAIISILTFNTSAFAEQIGVIDLNKILQNYTKSESARVDLKSKKADLQKFVENARKIVEAAKTTTAKKSLEDKYNAELKQKVNAINADQTKKVQEIQTNIYSAIQSVAAQKQISTVLSKESVIMGGQDFTDEVIKVLNEPPVK
jgi:Skp family chaperone for outer membrane proteins